MKYITHYSDHLLESVSVKEVARDEDAVQTVIDGKRRLAYLAITEQRLIDPRPSIKALSLALNSGLNIIPLRSRKEGVAFVVYKDDREAAQALADFAETKAGYLHDETPEEAQFIGQALEYNQNEIDEYIQKNYRQ